MHRNRASFTRLTAAELKLLHILALGRTTREAAQELEVKETTVGGYLRNIGTKLDVSGRGCMLHAAYQSGQLPCPEPLNAPVEFTDADRGLWEVFAAQGLGSADGTGVRELMARAGARSESHLVYLGHAFGILGPVATRAGRGRQGAADSAGHRSEPRARQW